MKVPPRDGFFSRLFPRYRGQIVSNRSHDDAWAMVRSGLRRGTLKSFGRPVWVWIRREEGDGMSTLLTISGVYRDGKVELSQRPEGLGENASVLVTFLPEPEASRPEPADQADDAAEAARRAAGKRLLEMLKKGIDLGGPPYPKREELYDRVDRFIERLEQGNG
jgi:hypothetical protein